MVGKQSNKKNTSIFRLLINNKKNNKKMEKRTLKLKELLIGAMQDAYNENKNYVIMKTLMHILENNESIVFNLNLQSSDIIIYKALLEKIDKVHKEDFYDVSYDDVSEDVIKLVKLHINRIKFNKL